MVLILEGEIVPDDDPRAIAYRRQRQPQPAPASSARGNTVADRQQLYQQPRGGRGQPQPGPQTQQNPQNPRRPGGPPSWLAPGQPLGNINEKLKETVAPFDVVGFQVQPIYLVAVLIALAFFGARGALLAALVCIIAGSQP